MYQRNKKHNPSLSIADNIYFHTAMARTHSSVGTRSGALGDIKGHKHTNPYSETQKKWNIYTFNKCE